MSTDRPRRRCGAPYCPRPATEGSSRCTEHRRELDATYQRHRDIYDDPRWLALSKLVLGTRPICEHCRRANATEVDHVIALRDGGPPFDINNVEALCHRCHARKTALETGLGHAVPAKVRPRARGRSVRRRRRG